MAEQSVTSTEDAIIKSDSPNDNFGDEPTLSVMQNIAEGFNIDTFLKFNIPDVDVEFAYLRLFVAPVPIKLAGNITLVAINPDDWNESTINFLNAPVSIAGLDISYYYGGNVNYWTNIDITSFIKANRGKAVSIHMMGTTDPMAMVFVSKEGTNKPNLRIIYTEAVPDKAIAHFTSEPSGATVYMNGDILSPTTPVSWSFDEPIIKDIVYKLSGYVDESFSINVAVGQEKTYHKVLTPTVTPPDTGGIVGIVTDSVTGHNLQGVRVAFPGGWVTTDINGNYSAQEITPGTYTFEYSKLGYNFQQINVDIIAGASAERNIQLVPSVSPPDFTEWWLDIVSVEPDGTFTFKETTVAPIDLQPWLQEHYIEKPLTIAAKVAFWTVLAAAGTVIIAKVLALAGPTIASKIAEDAPKEISDKLTITEVTLTPVREIIGKEGPPLAHAGMAKLLGWLGPMFTKKTLIAWIGAIIGYDALIGWLASDNIITGTTFSLLKIRNLVETGTITKDEAYTQIQMAQDWKDKATTFLEVSTILNPLLWLFKTQLLNNADLAQQNIDNTKLQIDAAVVTPPVEDKGKLTVNSTPSGAKIHIDDVYTFETTNTLILVDPGEHKLTLKLNDYEDYVENFTIAAAEEKTISATLTIIPTDITINISSTPTGAKIYIDNVYKFETTDTTISAPAGAHTLTLKLDGYKDHNLPYNWPAGSVKSMQVTLELLDEGEPVVDQPADEVVIPLEPVVEPTRNAWEITIKGIDSTTNQPVAAWILIDDDFKGVTTPAVFYLAPEQTYNIKLRLAGYRQGEITYTTLPLPTA